MDSVRFAESPLLCFLPVYLLVTVQVICVSLISPENTGFIVLHLELKCIYTDDNMKKIKLMDLNCVCKAALIP